MILASLCLWYLSAESQGVPLRTDCVGVGHVVFVSTVSFLSFRFVSLFVRACGASSSISRLWRCVGCLIVLWLCASLSLSIRHDEIALAVWGDITLSAMQAIREGSESARRWCYGLDAGGDHPGLNFVLVPVVPIGGGVYELVVQQLSGVSA